MAEALTILDSLPVRSASGVLIGEYRGPREHIDRIKKCDSLVIIGEAPQPDEWSHYWGTAQPSRPHHWFMMVGGALTCQSWHDEQAMRACSDFRRL